MAAEPDKKDSEVGVQGTGQPGPKQTDTTEKVEIARADFDRMMNAVEQLEGMKGQIEILNAAADKNKVAQIQDRLKQPGNSIVKLRTFRKDGEPKIVTAWVMTKNDSYQDPITKREVANQVISIVLEDNTSVELQYNDFSRFTEEKVLAEVIERNGDTYTVKVIGSDKPAFKVKVDFLN